MRPIFGKCDVAVAVMTTELSQPFSGTAADGWEEVMEAFRKVVDEEIHGGQAFAVYYEGQLVVDAWGGYMDIEKQRKWESNTVACGFSTTKAVSALVVAMLVDRGLLSYDDKVVKYWPEFGQNGKENVTVKMLLSHQAGIPAVEQPITVELMKDWEAFGKVLTAQKPFWEPGTAYGYHAFTFGFYVDQLVRRVDRKRRSISQFIQEEVTTLYEIDWRIGLPLSDWHRMAQGTVGETNQLSFLASLPSDSYVHLVFTNPPITSANGVGNVNNPDYYSVDIPAANGVGTARGLAKLFSLFAEGKLIQHKLIEQLLQPVNGLDGKPDVLLGQAYPCGWGFFFNKAPVSDHYVLNHPGYGGQIVKIDVQNQLAYAYLRNHYLGTNENPAVDAIEAAIYKKLVLV